MAAIVHSGDVRAAVAKVPIRDVRSPLGRGRTFAPAARAVQGQGWGEPRGRGGRGSGSVDARADGGRNSRDHAGDSKDRATRRHSGSRVDGAAGVVRIDRASAEDLMSLSGDNASVPMHVGAVLLLSQAGAVDVPEVMANLRERLPRVPRLRRRLVRAPLGGGRPVWVDDATFRLSDHIAVVRHRGQDLERAALDHAARLMTTRLDRNRPLWTARLIVADGGDAGGAALVLVFHHVLADGMAGLAVLAALTDDSVAVHDAAFPRPAPSSRQLRADAFAEHLHRLRVLPRSLHRSARALGVLLPALRVRAASLSLNRPTGARRRIETVGCALAAVRAAGAASGATINDVILTVVAGAISEVLSARGELVEELVISVPFSSRRAAESGQLGNHSGVVPFVVPTTGSFGDRLASVHEATARAKHGDRGSSALILGPAFRILAGTRLYRSFIDHQRMVHTIVTNVRGPDHLVRLAGLSVTQIIPLSVATGNITVAFAAASYAGRLTITLIADPEAVPDLDALRPALVEQLSALAIEVVR
ncbi:MAG: diacylglycerol O-acyltransferase / wax synthase [Microbacteriaceae bacterium]|nr:diacylglycerol O-acyltransferase / wax synthase [Microbacteriaceae bacterium]